MTREKMDRITQRDYVRYKMYFVAVCNHELCNYTSVENGNQSLSQQPDN